MAISKFEKTNTEKQELDLTEEGQHLKALYEKIDESLDKTNEHINKIATEENKVGISTAQANAIVENTAKTGITSNQASAITANTAKTGITTAQASAIAANTAKVGITTSQANLITALNQGVPQAVSTTTKGVTATIIPQVTINKKASTLDLSIRLSDGSIYATSLTLTRLK